MRFLFLLTFVTVILNSCAKKQPDEKKELVAITTTSNNTEQNEWINAFTIKPYANAHSGNSVSVIDSSSVYSVGYEKQLANISKSTINSVVFSYWVLLKNDKAEAKTVLSVIDTTSKKNVVWIGNLIKHNVKENNKWTEITETFQIPKNTDPKCLLKLYVLNASKEEVLLDDFKIAFY